MALDDMLAWLAEFEFNRLFGYLIVVLFCWVLGCRVRDAYGRGKKTVLEPVDAMEPERVAGAGRVQATQTEPTQAEPVHEPHETQEPRLGAVPVQLDLLGFSTKQK